MAMQVRVTVVRSCSVDTRKAGEMGTIALTCTGVPSGGVVTTGSGPDVRVVPVPTRQTTVVAARPTPENTTGPSATVTERPVRQIVTVNF